MACESHLNHLNVRRWLQLGPSEMGHVMYITSPKNDGKHMEISTRGLQLKTGPSSE